MSTKKHKHNSVIADNEPAWGSVDKTALPRSAFADQGILGRKSTWKYPHHWIKGGTKKDRNGIWSDGTMYLHQGGWRAAWAAAHGARSGKKAPASVISHLEKHRPAILQKKKSEVAALSPLVANATERAKNAYS